MVPFSIFLTFVNFAPYAQGLIFIKSDEITPEAMPFRYQN